MREIKFRARNANVPPTFIYGYYVVENGECSIVNGYGKFPIKCNTVEQYTGIKDKYGKEIYEGDIVEFDDSEIYYVSFSNGTFTLEPHKMCICNENVSNLRVIGNIYENPELVEAMRDE